MRISDIKATSAVRKFRKYPVYKDSGVKWLGEIPKHWQTKPMKRVFRMLNGATPKSSESAFWDGDIPWATPDDLGDLKGDTLFETRRYITDEGYNSCGTSLAPKGSLILSTRAPIGHLAIAGKPMCTNQGCRSLVFEHHDNTRYFYYLFLTAHAELDSLGQGSTFKELSRTKLEAVYITVPALIEQQAIASFLDRETARINQLIAKKERQIELLQEKRSALISHVVTKGLDAKAKMKDSGIEWLGEIPEHWEVKRFKYVMLLQRGHDLPAEQFDEGDYPVCASNGIIGYHNEFTTRGPSITVGRSGSVGEVNYIEMNFWAHNTALYVKSFIKAQPRYAYYLLKTLDVKYLSEGTAVGTLNRNYIHDLSIPLPNYSEQTAIAVYLDHETNRIDLMEEKISESIDRLREYRTALISAAITGKIDVREEVA